MNRAAAWSVRGVGRETRDAAQEAARRAGMSLGEWLDEVIADQAAEQGVDPDDFDEDDRLDAISERLSGLSRKEVGGRRSRGANDFDELRPRARARQAPAEDSRRAEALLDAAIEKFEGRVAKSDERTARAFNSVATWIERSQNGRRDERETLQTVVGRLESIEDRIANQQAALAAAAARPAAREEPKVERETLQAVVGRLESLEDRIVNQQAALAAAAARPATHEEPKADDRVRDLDERMNELARRIEASDKAHKAARVRPRLDINDAVSQIARRRQELDARTAVADPEPAKRGWRNFGVEAPGPAPRVELSPTPRVDPAPPVKDIPRENLARESAASALQIEIRKLSQRLDDMRREQSEKREAPPANIEALRTELAAMSRSLADLAPRNAVVALEGAIRDLTQRVAALRENGARGGLLAPVDGLVADLRESLRAHDPREAVESLQRDIAAIGAKVDGIAHASINPQTFERIRQQTEEARNLLATLAQRPMPVDRLERQISELADRIDRFPASAAPHAESAEVVASLAEARAQVERSTPASALTSIERRLEQIAAKMDQALERPLPAPIVAPRALEELSRRIDSVRETVENHYASPHDGPLDVNSLERSLREISAKLDRPAPSGIDASAFENMIHDLGARIDRRANPVIDTGPLEQVLRKFGERPTTLDTRPLEALMREISAKLEGALPTVSSVQPLENLMREISAKLDRPAAQGVDSTALENMIRDLGVRIDRRANPVIDTRPLEQTLRSLHDKIEQSASPRFAAEQIEQAVQILSRQIAAKSDAAPDIAALEDLIRGLESKFESARIAESDPRTLDAIGAEIAGIRDRLDTSHPNSSSTVALEQMVAELLAQLDQTRQALREISAPSAAAASGEKVFTQSLAELRAEQNNSDRRIQSTLGGVHDMLETLVDRIGQLEEDAGRAGHPSNDLTHSGPSSASNYGPAASAPANAALNSMDATIREAPVFAPARPMMERADKSQDARAPQFAPTTPMRAVDGSDFLIEPGAGAPLRARGKDAIAGGNPKNAVNAHIAAARRAAQAALAETANNAARDGARSAASASALTGASGIEQAKAFFAARRRPILLGVALFALIAIAAVELGVMRQPNVQRSEVAPVAAPKLASVAPAKDTNAPAPATKSDARAVDATPVGSISAPPAANPTTKFQTPAPADLVASLPAGTPQGLRDAAAAGDPAAQYELASRFADGRNMTRDAHAAAQWYERAAAQGLAPAAYRLGSLYEKGIGVTRDGPLAKAWYKKAAEAGNARAMHNLAVMIAEGAGIKPDYSEAADWFQKAARLGVKDSQYNLAILYARGMGLAQDLSQSWLWFSLAAQQGDVDAAKKRDEVAAKMDAKALAADAAALANFHAGAPNPAANEVAAPPGGWDFGKMTAPSSTPSPPTQPQATISSPRASGSTPL